MRRFISIKLGALIRPASFVIASSTDWVWRGARRASVNLFAPLMIGLISPVAALAQCCVAPPSGLVSWYAGEGDASDQLGNNPGTLQGGTSFTNGEVGKAFLFDGSSGYVSVPASSSLDLDAGGGGLTLECWIKPGDVSTSHVIAEWNNGTGASGMQFWTSIPGYGDSGSLFANFVDTAGGTHILTSASNLLKTNNFQHVAVTYDNTTGAAKIYYNGAVVMSQYIGSLTLQTTYDFYFGKRVSAGSSSPFLGVMDELSLYSRALTSSEILGIFNSGSAGKCGANSQPPPPAIVSQPSGRTVVAGYSTTFMVVVTGCLVAYQWQLGTSNILGATNATLTLTNIQPSQAGNYSVIISNTTASVTSSNALLTLYTNCISAPSGLVDWWPAEGNASDIVGGNNGTLQGGVGFAPGEVGQAFLFDGTNSYVSVPAAPGLDIGKGSGLTLECWIKPGDVSTSHVVAEWNDATNHSGMQLWTSVPAYGDFGSLFANFVDSAGGNHIIYSAQNVISTNIFQHVAVTYDKFSGVGSIYCNGAVKVSQNFGTFSPQTSYGFYVGQRVSAGSASPFNGLIDELSLYNRALTSSEILGIFNNGSLGKTCMMPQILTQPQNQTVKPGGNATFIVVANGSPPLFYRWFANGTNLTGATNSSLTLTNVQFSNVGNYYVSVSNALGSTNSSTAALKINLVLVSANGQLLTNAQYSFNVSATIQMQNVYSNGAIFYTLDGTTPGAGSTLYSGPFVISQSSVIRALGYTPDFSQSAISDPVTVQIIPFYTLTATSAGGGTVTKNPTNASYISNSVVNVTATPASGWTFLQWQGDTAGTSPSNNVLMSRNKSVQAVFGTTVSNTATGSGSVLFNPLGGIYPYGITLQASALPQAGNVFVLWGNAASSSTNPLSFIVTNANPTISALFTSLGSGQVALAVVPLGHGRVTVNPRANGYNTNTSVTITATPDAGKSFLGWSGNANGIQNPLTVIMSQSKTIYANFSTNNSLALKLGPGNGSIEGAEVDLIGELGTHYRLDGSSNLVNWVPLFNLTNSVGTIHFIDSGASNLDRRFYRSLILP